MTTQTEPITLAEPEVSETIEIDVDEANTNNRKFRENTLEDQDKLAPPVIADGSPLIAVYFPNRCKGLTFLKVAPDNYIDAALQCGFGCKDWLTRGECCKIRESTGLRLPRWLLKDPARRLDRGVYFIPELAERTEWLFVDALRASGLQSTDATASDAIARVIAIGEEVVNA